MVKQVVSKQKQKKRLSFGPLYLGRQELNANRVNGRISFLAGLVFDSRLEVPSIEKEDIWLLFGCPQRTIHFNRKKRTNPLKRGPMVALDYSTSPANH